MLQSINDLHGFTIHAEGREIGTIEISTSMTDPLDRPVSGRGHRQVAARPAGAHFSRQRQGRRLAGPHNFREISHANKSRTVRMSRRIRPVSRQHEEELSAYYGWPSYWTGDPFGLNPCRPTAFAGSSARPALKGDPHLRSAREVKGYHIGAPDGPVGHVSDFVFDDATWEIAFMIVDAGSWLHERLRAAETGLDLRHRLGRAHRGGQLVS